MSDYIEVGKILEFLDAETNALNSTFGEIGGEADAYVACFKNIRSYIERFPTADVAPVIHSYWESYSCSQFMGTDGWANRNGVMVGFTSATTTNAEEKRS